MFSSTSLLSKEVLIVGGGFAGLSCARALAQQGIAYTIIEKKPDFSEKGMAITLPANGHRALVKLGFEQEIKRIAPHRVNKIIYSNYRGEILGAANLADHFASDDYFTAWRREDLHTMLRRDLENKIYVNATINKMIPYDDGILVYFNHASLPPKKYAAVMGADGIHSSVRQRIDQTPLVDLNVTCWRWICNYPTENLQPTYMLHPRHFFLAYPLSQHEVYCYAHTYDPEYDYEKALDQRAALLNIFGEFQGIAKSLLPFIPHDQAIVMGRLRSMPAPLFANERIGLLGDASHACSPQLQQGAPSAFEDALALARFIKEYPMPLALQHYEKYRSERVKWVMDQSDNPLRSIINANAETFAALENHIRLHGPLNVLGWKHLLATNPLNEIENYIKNERACSISSFSPATHRS